MPKTKKGTHCKLCLNRLWRIKQDFRDFNYVRSKETINNYAWAVNRFQHWLCDGYVHQGHKMKDGKEFIYRYLKIHYGNKSSDAYKQNY